MSRPTPRPGRYAVRHLIELAFEGMPNDVREVLDDNEIRQLVTTYVRSAALSKGVILEDVDITSELDQIVPSESTGERLVRQSAIDLGILPRKDRADPGSS